MSRRPTDDRSPEIVVVIAAVTALLTGIGALTLTGALGRVQRNHGTDFALAIALVVFGSGIAVVASRAIPSPPSQDAPTFRRAVRHFVEGFGALLAVTGVLLAFVLAVTTAGETERPRISVRFDHESLTLSGAVTAANLSSRDGLEVRVEALEDLDLNAYTVAGAAKGDDFEPITISRAFVGPDGDGTATQQLDVRLPHGNFDAVRVTASVGDDEPSCEVQKSQLSVDGGTACVSLPLPRRIRYPDLTAVWGPASRTARTVVVKAVARDLNAGSDRASNLLLRAVGLRRGRAVPIYRTVIDPPARGMVARTVRFTVPADVRVVCVGTARAPRGRMACPIRGTDVSAVELRAMPSAPPRR